MKIDMKEADATHLPSGNKYQFIHVIRWWEMLMKKTIFLNTVAYKILENAECK